MARCARKKSASGIYHIMIRGINRQDIFFDNEDYRHFLEIMKRVKDSRSCAIYGYCLMGNHIHLLIHEKEENISVVMQRIGTSYAWWYNQKYDRVGHVFQNRFQSETVETEEYLLSVIRYIHNNPVKAKLVAKPEEYPWSSCQGYYGGKDFLELFDTVLILNILNSNGETARLQFLNFMQTTNDDEFLEISDKQRKSDEDLAQELKRLLKGQSIGILQSMDIEQRKIIIKQLKAIVGVTQRQIARVTGFHQSIIFKV